MHFGLQIPYLVPVGRDELTTWVTRADAGPFRTINIGERITYDNPDQFAAIAAAAVLTARVRILTNVTVLPIHAPALAAKAFATIDRFCEGRLILTPGVGSRPEDFAAAGTTYDHRWQRLDDAIDAMQRLWRGEAAEPSGTVLGPAPFTEGGPPLHCAAAGPKALARAVRWACGYQGFTTNGDASTLQGIASTITGAFEAAGRPRPELGVTCFFALGDDAAAQLAAAAHRYFAYSGPDVQRAMTAAITVSSADAIARTVANAADAGFDEVHFNPTTTDPGEIDRLEAVLTAL
jgi:alkanesulfonate monooxygenase SsuD/methylene tetrahydromethanopterin reductase-like flavin-dependent oxidoreductase (luciferase family)